MVTNSSSKIYFYKTRSFKDQQDRWHHFNTHP